MILIHRIAVIATAWFVLNSITASCFCDRDHEQGRKGVYSHPSTYLGTTGTALLTSTPMQWDSAVGSAIVIAMDSRLDSVSVVRPEYLEGRYSDTTVIDLRVLEHIRFDLLGRSGVFGTVVLTASKLKFPLGSKDGCIDWPTAIIPVTKRGWRVALETGHANIIRLDSIEGMSPSDSAVFVAQLIHMVSALPELHNPVFNNVPFVVRSAYHFKAAFIDGIIVSTYRNIPSEAVPREEHVFLIAERPVGSLDKYHVAFLTRSAGGEGAAQVTDVLAGVVLSQTHRIAIIVSNEYEDANAVALIERIAPYQWRLMWRSAYVGC